MDYTEGNLVGWELFAFPPVSKWKVYEYLIATNLDGDFSIAIPLIATPLGNIGIGFYLNNSTNIKYYSLNISQAINFCREDNT